MVLKKILFRLKVNHLNSSFRIFERKDSYIDMGTLLESSNTRVLFLCYRTYSVWTSTVYHYIFENFFQSLDSVVKSKQEIPILRPPIPVTYNTSSPLPTTGVIGTKDLNRPTFHPDLSGNNHYCSSHNYEH